MLIKIIGFSTVKIGIKYDEKANRVYVPGFPRRGGYPNILISPKVTVGICDDRTTSRTPGI